MRYLESARAAWDRTARKYAVDVDRDIEFLRRGGVALLEREARMLGSLVGCRRAIHLQCSHGLEALSLLNLGAGEVIGVDLSSEMLDLARRKSDALRAQATWVQADVLQVPEQLSGISDLVFTGGGALPWVSDLTRWAETVARLLRPGGRLFVSEGHPLNWVWDVDAASHRLTQDGRSYFDREPRPNDTFPASAIERFTPKGEQAPLAWEYQWNLGDVVTAVCDSGLRIERLEEHADQFWPKLQAIPEEDLARLPHAFSLLARAPAV